MMPKGGFWTSHDVVAFVCMHSEEFVCTVLEGPWRLFLSVF